ncbi:MAG: DUF2157 domain-containing protein [Acidobacteriia bacterium]|nr:DUF2157 domain-containing protein [Terriglobia bacterium]
MAETSGKKEAQQRVDRIHSFRRELEQLTREGVLGLTDEQRARLDTHLDKTLAELAGRFDVDVSESQKQISLAMRIASALGGLALCAAVFLFFYRYWGLLSTPVQVALLVSIPILGLIAMEFVSRRERTLYYTSLLALVVFASFVLNLNVLGYIFNLAPSQNAFLAWGVFALVLAYGYSLRLELAAGLVLLVIFVAAQIMSLSGGSFDAVMDRPETFLPGGMALLAIPLIHRHSKHPGFATVYRLFGLLFLFLALLMLGNLGHLTYLPFPKKAVEGIYQVTGFGAVIAAIWIGVQRRMMEAVNLGSAFFAIYLFLRLFNWWWDWMPKYLFFLIIGIIALVLLAVFRKIRTGTGKMETA